MRDKILKPKYMVRQATTGAEFVPAEYTGMNESGFDPIGDKVLVLPDSASDITSGGVNLPDDMVERHTLAAETGVLISIGGGAFLWHSDGSKWSGYKPKAGDRIYMERYAGQVLFGRDGKHYRLMNSTCIGAIGSYDITGNLISSMKDKVNVITQKPAN